MKVTKNQWSNFIFLILIATLLFTPAGTYVKVLINKAKVAVVSPKPNENAGRVSITNYQWRLGGLDDGLYNFDGAKGKVALINFWATWCPPCIAEMPSLQELYNSYSGKVEFYFVTNDKPETVKAFMKKKGYTFPVFFNASEPPVELYSKSIPATYVIGKTGEIVIKELGAANWNSESVHKTLDKLLTE